MIKSNKKPYLLMRHCWNLNDSLGDKYMYTFEILPSSIRGIIKPTRCHFIQIPVSLSIYNMKIKLSWTMFKSLLDKNPTVATFEQHSVRKQSLIFLCFQSCLRKWHNINPCFSYYCISLISIPPWIMSPFLKKQEPYSNFCTFKITSLVNVPGH